MELDILKNLIIIYIFNHPGGLDMMINKKSIQLQMINFAKELKHFSYMIKRAGWNYKFIEFNSDTDSRYILSLRINKDVDSLNFYYSAYYDSKTFKFLNFSIKRYTDKEEILELIKTNNFHLRYTHVYTKYNIMFESFSSRDRRMYVSFRSNTERKNFYKFIDSKNIKYFEDYSPNGYTCELPVIKIKRDKK